MDFGVLPPEINSARMYAGPGAGSVLVAAAAWDRLAAHLRSTASSYSSTLAGLAAEWSGPSSSAMAAAAGPYVAWMNTTAAQAEQTAGHARTAVAAYEAALAATVAPPLIDANRAALAALNATNLVGQNAGAIAAVESEYADMWAQDAAAMYGYAAQSASASRLPMFSAPPRSTDPSAQPAAVVGATENSVDGGSQSLFAQTTTSLQSLAGSAATDPSGDANSALSLFIRDVLNPFGSLSPFEKGPELLEFSTAGALPARNALVSSTLGFALATRGFNTGELPVPLIPGTLFPPVADTASAVSAGMGRAGLWGGLSVPPATPAIRMAAAVLQGAGTAGAPLAFAGEGALLSEIAVAGVAGGAVGGTAVRAAAAAGVAARGSESDRVQDVAGEQDSKTSDKLKRVLSELSQDPKSVQHWHTDKAHLDALLERLSTTPGVHAVHVSARHKPNPSSRQPRWG